MDRVAIKKSLTDILEHTIGESFEGIQETTSLFVDLGLDSLDMASMAIEVQAEFKIELKTDELRSIVHVGDLLDLIQAELPATRRHAA